MAANINPIYTVGPILQSVAIPTGVARSDGVGTIGTDHFLLYAYPTSGAGGSGGRVDKVRFVPSATTPTTTTATVGRLYLSSVSTGAITATTVTLLGEVSLPATAAANSAAPITPFEIPVGFSLEPGQSLLVSTHVTPAANTQWKALAIAGAY